MKVYVVYGAPLSGKTTWVKNNIGYNDIVYDFDAIMGTLTHLPYQAKNSNIIGYVLDIRDSIIRRLHRDNRLDNAYLISVFIGKMFEESLKGLDVEFIKMEATKQECMSRLATSNRENQDELAGVIQDWFEKYGEDGKHIKIKDRKKLYKSLKWREKRQEILERDNFECVWCKRKGLVTVNDREVLEVDHIIEIERAPELIYEDDNLRTLCRSCHSIRHNRFGNKETGQTIKAEHLEREFPESW